jgi:DNA end-binding protein Ku
MASIWKGSISFGLVNVPVELRGAVRSDHIVFRLLHEKDNTPVRYERVRADTGEAVPWNEIVKGYEYSKGKFVVLTDEDFTAAALESSKIIDISDFVNEAEIDPRFFETPYFVVPAKGAEHSYALLREAMRSTNTVGIGKITIRQKQHLAGMHVVEDAIVLELMRFAAEIVDESTYEFPAAKNVRPQELQMAEQLVSSMSAAFEPGKYTDEYRDNLMKVITAKSRGKEIELPETREAPETKVIDLMARLRESLEQGRAATATKSAGRAPRAKSARATSTRAHPRKRRSA